MRKGSSTGKHEKGHVATLSNPVLLILANVLFKCPPKSNCSYPEERSAVKISEQLTMFF